MVDLGPEVLLEHLEPLGTELRTITSSPERADHQPGALTLAESWVTSPADG